MLRDKRWLFEVDGRFYDCGNSCDGAGYGEVTDSNVPEVIAARERFAAMLTDKPAPGPDDPLMRRYRAKMPGKKQQKKRKNK